MEQSRIRIDIGKDKKTAKPTKSALVAAVQFCEYCPKYKVNDRSKVVDYMKSMTISRPEESSMWYASIPTVGTGNAIVRAVEPKVFTNEFMIIDLLVFMMVKSGMVSECKTEDFV